MEANIEKYKKFGADLACVLHGVDPYTLDIKQAAHATASQDTVVKTCVCKMAADMYEGCGKKDLPEYWVFKKLAAAYAWPEPLNVYFDSALTGLGTVVERVDREFAGSEKSARVGFLAGLIPSLVGKGVAATPSMIVTLAGLGAGVGAAGGAVSWKMNQDADKDEAKLEAIKARIDYYNQITDAISRDLEDKGMVTDEELEQYEQHDPIA